MIREGYDKYSVQNVEEETNKKTKKQKKENKTLSLCSSSMSIKKYIGIQNNQRNVMTHI